MTEQASTNTVPFAALVARTQLVSVDIVEAHVIRDGLGLPAGYEVALEGGIAPVEIGLTYQFTVEIYIQDEKQASVAKVKIVANVTYAIEDSPQPEDPLAQQFGSTVGWSHAYPYVRQLAADLTAKIGLPPISLDVTASMSMGEPQQAEVSEE